MAPRRASVPAPPPMCFTGSVIDRSAALLKQKTHGFFAEVLSSANTKFLLLHCGAALCCRCESPVAEGVVEPYWLSLDRLLGAGVRLELPPDVAAIDGHDISAVAGNAVTVLLGHVSAEADDGAGPGWRVAVEWGKHSDIEAGTLLQTVASIDGEQLSWCGGRELYHRLRWTDAAAVGHAICATGWHLKALYCGLSGQNTVPVEAGAKRNSIDRCTSRVYPRIDPCCIMLVVSKDRTRCLLSHPKRLRSGVWTCLAGFIDSCESVEEAVRRETMEEAGIVVDEVELVSSQPWPLGRGGAELMIACKAVARSSKIAVGDTTEYASMDDVRWFSRPEAREMLLAAREAYQYSAPSAQTKGRQQQEDTDHTAPHPTPDTLLTPGPYAVAYHLIKDWVVEEDAKCEASAGELEHTGTGVPLGQSRAHVAKLSTDASETTGLFSARRLGQTVCIFLSGAATATALVSAAATV